MKPILQKISRFLVSQDGSTAVHSAVLLAVIVIVSLAVISSLDTAGKS